MARTNYNKISVNGTTALWLVIMAALLLRGALLLSVDVVNSDAIRYFNAAHELMQGNLQAAFSHEKMLVYAGLLGIVNAMAGDWAFSGLFISALFMTLTLFPLYVLTRDAFGDRAALWATAALVLLPASNELSTGVVKDAPFLFFLMMALWLGRKGMVERRPTFFVATFICAACATLFRFEAVIFMALYATWLLGLLLFVPRERAMARIGLICYAAVPALSLGLLAALLAAGFYDLNAARSVWDPFGQHYFDTDVLGICREIYDHLKSVENNFPGGQWTNDFFEIARYNLLLIYLLGVLEKLAAAVFPAYLLPLCCGMKSARVSERRLGLLVASILSYLGMAYYFIITRNFLAERYLVVVVVMLLPFVGHGVEQLNARFSLSRFRNLALAAAVVLFVCLPLYRTYANTRGEKTELRQAGAWLHEQKDLTRQRLIASDERIPFYAGLMRGGYEVFAEGSWRDYEHRAAAGGSPLAALYVSLPEGEEPPAFAGYLLVKVFRAEGKAVLIYEDAP